MKRILALLALAALNTGAWAQGFVTIMDGLVLVQTNAVAIGGGIGNTSTVSNSFFYEVLIAPTTVTTVDASLQGLLTSTWSDSGITGVNNPSRIGAGKILAVNNQALGCLPETFQSAIVVGWSANLGTTWSQVSAELAGATFNGNYWSGGGLPAASFGFLGASTIAVAAAGSAEGNAAALFTLSSSPPVPIPISTGPVLYVTAVLIPEPAALALGGFGLAWLALFRRRH